MSRDVAELVKYDEIVQVVGTPDADFLLETAEGLAMPSLIQPHCPPPSVSEKIATSQQRIIDSLKQIDGKSALSRIPDEEILEILWMAYYSGALFNTDNIHIHDLCGGDGHAALFTAFARGGGNSTSVACFDTKNEKAHFEFLGDHLKISGQLRSYSDHDVATADLNKRQYYSKYWIARRPKGMSATIIKRLLELPEDKLPSSLTILPSEWYGYDTEENQIGETADMETWRRLSKIRSTFHLSIFEALGGKRLSAEQELVTRVTEMVMDCLRIAVANDRSTQVHGKLQEFPSGNRRDLLILSKKDK